MPGKKGDGAKGYDRHSLRPVGSAFPLRGRSADHCSDLNYNRSPFIAHGMVVDANETALKPGQLLARGVCRHLLSHDFVSVEELTPTTGLRVDVMALGPKYEIWIVECKSSRSDFETDGKWQGYLEWCDRYFWAVDDRFPLDLLPDDTGLMVADSYDAELVRMGPENRLSAARRKMLMARFARHAALRWHGVRDPGLPGRLVLGSMTS